MIDVNSKIRFIRYFSTHCFFFRYAEHLITSESTTINNVNLQNDLVHTDANQTITGDKTFENIHSHQDITLESETLNNVNITEWLASVITINSSQSNDNSTKHFTAHINVTDLITHKLNNEDIESLIENLLTLSGDDATIDTIVTFENLTTQGSLMVKGTVNGLKIPDDVVVLSEDQVISGTKHFVYNNITITNITRIGVTGSEDFSEFMTAAALHNSPNQTFETNITFTENVNFSETSITADLLNSHNVSDWITINTEQTLTGNIRLNNDTIFMGGSISADTIVVEGAVNGIDISELAASAIYKDSNDTISGRIVFVNGIDCKQNLSVAGLINGVNLTDLFNQSVRISKPQTVTGRKYFTGGIHMDNTLNVSGTINDVNIQELKKRSLQTNGKQQLYGNVTLKSNLNVTLNASFPNGVNEIDLGEFLETKAAFVNENGTLSLNGSISISNIVTESLNITSSSKVDNIDLNNLLLNHGNQTISGDVSFTNITTNDGIAVDGLLNGVNFTDVVKRSMLVTGDQNMTAHHVFSQSSHVKVNGNLETIEYFNGVDLEKFKTNAVTLNEATIIEGHLRFDSETTTVVEEMETSTDSLFDKVNMTRVLTDALMSTENQTVCHKLQFNSKLTIVDSTFNKDLQNNFLNGFDILKLNQTAVYLFQNIIQNVSGHLYFHQLQASQLTARDTINQYTNLAYDFVTTGYNGHLQNISSDVTFAQDVVFNGDLQVDRIDGVDFVQLAESVVSLNTYSVINGTKNFTGKVSIGGSVVLPNIGVSTVNTIPPTELIETNSSIIKIESTLDFTSLTTDHFDVLDEGLINNVDFNTFYENALRHGQAPFILLQDQTFTGDLTILGKR